LPTSHSDAGNELSMEVITAARAPASCPC